MIELAPNSKRGLELSGPLLVAAGGYGDEFDPKLLSRAHGLVTLATTLRPRAPSLAARRIREFPGGFLLKRSGANPGLASVLREQSHIWSQLNLPVILTLGSADVRNWAEIARRTAQSPSLSGLLLELREEMDVSEGLSGVKSETDLPILAWIPLERTLEIAETAVKAGADALTIARAPRGMATVDGKPWRGRVVGPAVLPLALRAVSEAVEHFPGIPVIGAGGVRSGADVHAFLQLGALAVHVDNVLWRDPDALAEIADEIEKWR